MSIYRRWQQALLSALLLVLLITTWIVLAPIQLGGQAAYVIVDGQSMEPNYHLGDLAIVRQSSSYEIGDIVVYQSAALHRYVFHRIINIEADHFVLKGDNNSWTDSYQPIQSEIIGRFWLRIPAAGKLVEWMRLPAHVPAIVGIAAGLVIVSLLVKRRHGKSMKKKSVGEWFHQIREEGFRQLLNGIRRRSSITSIVTREEMLKETSASSGVREGIRARGETYEILFFVLGTIAFASLVLGYFAFTRSAQHLVPDNINYQHIGGFSYSAAAPSGIYDSSSIHSGEPLFPKLTCTVDMGFTYALAGISPDSLSGTYQLVAKIFDPQSGWQRTIPLTEQKTFSGTSFTENAPLNLCQIEALVANVEQETDLHVPSYTLAITPIVSINGTAAGQELKDTFEPQLLFQFDSTHFFIVKEDSAANPLNPSEPGVLEKSRMEANTIPVLGQELAVPGIRVLSIIGLLLSLGGLAILGIFVSALAKQNPETFLQAKYGPLLIDVHEKSIEAPAPMIDVDTIDDLAKLAERNNTMILHQKRNRIHFYTVRADRFTYRYTTGEDSGVFSPYPLAQLEDDLQRGLERGEFQVFYQPIMSLPDGKIFGMEALLRWIHPKRGLVPAAEFIAAAEATGLIDTLGDWLLQVACSQLREWRESGYTLILSINLSEHQLEGDPASSIMRVLQNTGLDAHALQIEIPERQMIEHTQSLIPKLQDLKNLGINISIDDPTGQSVLSSSPQLPVTSIKFDRSFVQQINNQVTAGSVDKAIEAARGLGLNVIAQGVETQEQLEFLQSHYCNFAQGYLLGRPASAEEITRSLLKDQGPKSHRHRKTTNEPSEGVQ